jgi:ubiquinone/menaquinone biosynthesis C-methylase UbiE
MVERFGTGGWLVGLDASEVMIAEARRRAEQSCRTPDRRGALSRRR